MPVKENESEGDLWRRAVKEGQNEIFFHEFQTRISSILAWI